MESINSFENFKSNPELLEKLYSNSSVKNFKQGDVILNESSIIRSIPIVIEGSIKVLRTDDDGR